MGQKVNPIGMRVGVIRDWDSRWYAEKNNFANLLHEDALIREYIEKNLKDAYISRVEIERSKNRVDVIIRTARPGVVIGVNGASIEKTKAAVAKISAGSTVNIKVLEVANPDLDAHLVARNIAEQLEQRASFRTAQKRTIQRTMRSGAKGIKTAVSGRLGGADMARTEGYAEGVVPLHTLRADIDYAHYEANTQFGILGVKVWICRGEVLPGQLVQEPEAPKAGKFDRPRRRRNDRNDRRPNNRPQNAKPAAEAANKDEQGGN
ncbi:30S ribosomal protein S3 [Erysipelothrix sp. HDW6C]|uniref:30S ribosomal protein S3 n=1 Tax=Erysipelothrix sp. HDW6C TaxID=2714930 RepID=UPI00140A39C6|nr:30S ribosomal protein S3 [Erysipelothrix sp. HDW6C]QIK69794.1 30S ribosomal protein S3 [Erysipelothrix sp. HDW6C]